MNINKLFFPVFIFIFLFPSLSLLAQKKQLTRDELSSAAIRLTEPAFQVVEWKKKNILLADKEGQVIVVNIKTGKTTCPSEKDTATLPVRQTASVIDGDIYLQWTDGREEQLTHFAKTDANPVFSPDSSYIAFTRNNDLYTIRLSDKKETRLTFDGSDVILNGYASWVYMEEILGRSNHYKAFWWSPDSKHIAFFRTDDSRVPLFTITDSPGKNGYVETLRYPKAGDPIPQIKTGIVKPEGGKTIWAAVAENDDHYFGLPYWRPDGKALWLQWLSHGQDQYKLIEIATESGASRELYTEQQKTWIAIDDEPRIHFLTSGKGFIFRSDKSGWNQLYLHDMDGKLQNAITGENCIVRNLMGVDEKEKTVYFTCYKDNIGCEDFYKVALNGKNLKRLSFGNYNHSISLSNDFTHFVTTYSNVTTPPKIALYATSGKFISAIQDTKTDRLDIYEYPRTTFMTLISNDGKYRLPMHIIWPLHMEKGKTYPVKLSIYGGPDALRVRNNWTNTFGGEIHRYAQDGLIQVTVDHRGSGHNGKAGQNEMHRRLGYWEMEDYKQCVKWLIENGQADPEKIMITGFSYGGYLTCYALTYGADVFTHGSAGGSVTDWLLYDAIYTERYMDTPSENPEGYHTASALAHADKLKGTLLLTHGLRDENVHVQNTFQFVSLLEDAGKTFELMIYPESRHGYRGAKREHHQELERTFIYKYLLSE